MVAPGPAWTFDARTVTCVGVDTDQYSTTPSLSVMPAPSVIGTCPETRLRCSGPPIQPWRVEGTGGVVPGGTSVVHSRVTTPELAVIVRPTAFASTLSVPVLVPLSAKVATPLASVTAEAVLAFGPLTVKLMGKPAIGTALALRSVAVSDTVVPI